MRQRFQEAVSKAPQGATPYELELYAHNYLIGVCDYDEEAVELQKPGRGGPNEQNAYGALVEGKAVCEGYTRAFQLLCDRLSVPCWVIQGQAEGFDGEGNTNHIWNCVMLDGDWYQVDVTWDDYDSNPTVGDEQYFYFNLTTAEMLKDHIIAPSYSNYQSSDIWYNGFVPECTATSSIIISSSTEWRLQTSTTTAFRRMSRKRRSATANTVCSLWTKAAILTKHTKASGGYAYQWITTGKRDQRLQSANQRALQAQRERGSQADHAAYGV